MTKSDTFFGKLLNILDIVILILCIVSIGLFIYLKWLAPDKYTEMVTYMGVLENVDNKVCAVNVSYYENKDGSGEELFEIKLSGYTDTNAKEITSFGVQVLGDFKKLASYETKRINKKWLFFETDRDYYTTILDFNRNSKNLCFYSETDDLSYKNVDTSFDDFGFIRLKINDKIYAFCFGCEIRTESSLGVTSRAISSFSSFILNMHEKVKSLPVGHSYTTFGFKNMFKVMEFKDNQYNDITNQDDVFNYCYVNVNHYTTGAKTANDSVFKNIQYNTNWSINGASLLDGHFSDKSTYCLTEKDCVFKYDETLNKHLFDINDNCYKNYIKKKNLNYELVLDLDYLTSVDIIFGGVSSNNRLKELGITKYYITSNGEKTGVSV